METIGNLCALASIPDSIAGMAWSVILALWPWYWLFIVPALGLWVTFEIKTRNGTVHYNSKNGFSPIFNTFVGSGTYAGLQAIIYLFLKFVIGEAAYCVPWPYVLHIVVFASTAFLLNAVGFWPEIRIAKKQKPRWRRKKRF